MRMHVDCMNACTGASSLTPAAQGSISCAGDSGLDPCHGWAQLSVFSYPCSHHNMHEVDEMKELNICITIIILYS